MEAFDNISTFSIGFVSSVHHDFGIAVVVNDGRVSALVKDDYEEEIA